MKRDEMREAMRLIDLAIDSLRDLRGSETEIIYLELVQRQLVERIYQSIDRAFGEVAV
jgi:hypothetical protein